MTGAAALLLLVAAAASAGQDLIQPAVQAFEQRRYEEVLALLARLPAEQAARPAVPYLKALALAQMGRYDEAAAASRRAQELDPANPVYVQTTGQICLAKRDYAAAARAFEDGTRRFPRDAALAQGFGEVLLRLEKLSEAEPWLRKAVELDPNSGAAHALLASLFYALGDQEKLGAEASKAFELDPNDYLACFYYGVWLVDSKGQTDQGLKQIQRSVQLQPRFAAGFKGLGTRLAHIERWPQAALAYERAAGLNPGDSEVFFLLSVAYRNLGEQAKADSALARYRELSATPAGRGKP